MLFIDPIVSVFLHIEGITIVWMTRSCFSLSLPIRRNSSLVLSSFLSHDSLSAACCSDYITIRLHSTVRIPSNPRAVIADIVCSLNSSAAFFISMIFSQSSMLVRPFLCLLPPSFSIFCIVKALLFDNGLEGLLGRLADACDRP